MLLTRGQLLKSSYLRYINLGKWDRKKAALNMGNQEALELARLGDKRSLLCRELFYQQQGSWTISID